MKSVSVREFSDELKNIIVGNKIVKSVIRRRLLKQSVKRGRRKFIIRIFSKKYELVLESKEDGIIDLITDIRFEMNEKEICGESFSFENLGGMKEVIMFVKKNVDYVCFNEKIFKFQMHGLLIHGSSGTGKSALLEGLTYYLKKEKNIRSVYEIKMDYKDFIESRNYVKKLFSLAKKNQPSIIILDEINNYVKNKKLIMYLEYEIDNLCDTRVLFVCTTSYLRSLPMSLRRPGRIDREIEIHVPNEKDRLEIVKNILNGKEDGEEILSCIAERTIGFVGSDLKFLCDEYISTLSVDSKVSKEKLVKQLLENIKPSSIKHIQFSVPKVKWSDIGGQDYLKRSLKECIEWQYRHKNALKRMGIKPSKGILLYGPPELFSKWVGESEKAVKKLFDKARQASPCILFFDEFDGIAVERGNEQQSSVGDRVLSQLLSELDGIRYLPDVTIVAATNRPDLIDKALLRPGRFDRIIYVKPPDYFSRVSILKLYINKMVNDIGKEAICKVAKNTKNYSGAELYAIVREAAYIALNENSENIRVKDKHLLLSSKKVKSRIKNLKFYEDFNVSFSKL